MSSRAAKGMHLSERKAEPFLYAPATIERTSQTVSPAPQTVHAGIPEGNTPAEQRAYEKGLGEGEARARAVFEKKIGEVRSGVSAALRQFTTQRETYFSQVESEVVQLALSIAKKILHREAKIDPLLLTGVVRVALESVNDGTQVRIRSNPDEVRFWRAYFEKAEDISPKPELIGDASLEAGCCMVETDLGSTLVSFDAQLKEIEQGFLDLLERRPRMTE